MSLWFYDSLISHGRVMGEGDDAVGSGKDKCRWVCVKGRLNGRSLHGAFMDLLLPSPVLACLCVTSFSSSHHCCHLNGNELLAGG